MVASFLTQLTEWQFYTQHPVAALIGLFQLWMGVDAIRRRDPQFFEKLSLQQSPEYLWIG